VVPRHHVRHTSAEAESGWYAIADIMGHWGAESSWCLTCGPECQGGGKSTSEGGGEKSGSGS